MPSTSAKSNSPSRGSIEIPVNRHKHRVEIELHQPRPDRLHRFERRRGRIAELAAEDQKGFAVDDQLRRRALLCQVWDFALATLPMELAQQQNSAQSAKGQSRLAEDEFI